MNLAAMSASFFQTSAYEHFLDLPGYPDTNQPLWILGAQYNLPEDRLELDEDIYSKFWFTYRKGFTPIGGVGPSTDQGWGCMLRCGQMMLAQALVMKHLGRDFRWSDYKIGKDRLNYENEKMRKKIFHKILQLFSDHRDAPYSVHQIASMGVSEGKEIGEWFGPNTIAHVLKKLVKYDDWSGINIHVAMDNTIFIDDIISECLQIKPLSPLFETNNSDKGQPSTSSSTHKNQSLHSTSIVMTNENESSSNEVKLSNEITNRKTVNNTGNESSSNDVKLSNEITNRKTVNNTGNESSSNEVKLSNAITNRKTDNNNENESSSYEVKLSNEITNRKTDNNTGGPAEDLLNEDGGDLNCSWTPLLLIIPLRLGISQVNLTYAEQFKACFRLKQCIGVIGGRPSHAYWFIGYSDNKLFYLDPHSVQPYVNNNDINILLNDDRDDDKCFEQISLNKNNNNKNNNNKNNNKNNNNKNNNKNNYKSNVRDDEVIVNLNNNPTLNPYAVDLSEKKKIQFTESSCNIEAKNYSPAHKSINIGNNMEKPINLENPIATEKPKYNDKQSSNKDAKNSITNSNNANSINANKNPLTDFYNFITLNDYKSNDYDDGYSIFKSTQSSSSGERLDGSLDWWQSQETYHTQLPSCMDITQLDPSLAIGFFCQTKLDFDILMTSLQNDILNIQSDSSLSSSFSIIDSQSTSQSKVSHNQSDIITVQPESSNRANSQSIQAEISRGQVDNQLSQSKLGDQSSFLLKMTHDLSSILPFQLTSLPDDQPNNQSMSFTNDSPNILSKIITTSSQEHSNQMPSLLHEQQSGKHLTSLAFSSSSNKAKMFEIHKTRPKVKFISVSNKAGKGPLKSLNASSIESDFTILKRPSSVNSGNLSSEEDFEIIEFV